MRSRSTEFKKRLGRVVGMALVFALALQSGALLGCSSTTNAAEKTTAAATTVDTMANRTITDDAGRQVTVPGVGALKKIYFTSPLAQIFCFTLAPGLAGGTTTQFNAVQLEYLPKGTADLPYLGTLSSGSKLNPEAIVAEGIQVIFSISSAALTETDKSTASDLQAQTGIPVVCIDGSMDKISTAYRKLGTILGREKEAEKLASYCENTLAAVNKAVATVPEKERVSFYYAEGPKGLQTEPETSQHALAFKIAGVKNVATVATGSAKGMSEVSLEQVLSWNPQVIVAWDDVLQGGADEVIRTSADWSSIDAVKNGRVYTMPNVPFSWCDRPPAVNRFLGIQWIANTLYPNAYKVNMVDVTREFYSMFYHVDISEAQAQAILGNSYKK